MKLTASLDFIVRFSIMDKAASSFSIYGDVALSVGATIFWVKLSKSWDIVHGELYSSNGAGGLLEHYMYPNDDPDPVDAVSDEPHSYPALASEATRIAADANAQADFKVVQAKGQTCLFYLGDVQGDDRSYRRVSYINLNMSGRMSTIDYPDGDSFGGTVFFAIAHIPQELAIKAGDFEDVTLGVRNEGNMAIVTFDVSMYEVVSVVESENPVETMHINALEPDKNTLTMADGTVLLVRDSLPTGDHSRLAVYLAIALGALILLTLVSRKGKRAKG